MIIEEMKKEVLVIDIETSASYPDGNKIDIRTNFDDYLKYASAKWIGMYSYKFNEYNNIEIKDNNIQTIKDYISKHKIIVGFNNEEFDIPILFNNNLWPDKNFNIVDLLVILGASTFQKHNGLPFKNRGALMGYKFKRNSLKFMAQEMKVETQKGDIDYNIFFKDEWTEEERKDIIKYLEGDIKATKEIFDLVWDFWKPFTEFLSEKNIKNLSWIKSSIASLTYQAACNTLGVEETYAEKTDKKKEEMGGRVIEPKYQEARNVWYVDFASLYPHIFTMFNLFNEIKDMDENEYMKYKDVVDIWHGNNIFNVKGYYGITEQHPLAKDVEKKLKTRIDLKKTEPKNPMIYTLKIFLNSLYGAVRSPIFEQIHTENAGWDCCWLGQQIQRYTEDRMKDFGFETIAGDTDSIFVILKDEDQIGNHNFTTEEFYVKQCLKTIVNEIKDNVPFPAETFDIDIEDFIDYIMWPFVMQPIQGKDGKNLKNGKGRLIKEYKGKKKNYIYLIYKNDEYKIKTKGLSIIKDDATPLGREIFEKSIKPLILESKSAKFSEKLIYELLSNRLYTPHAMKGLAREYKVKPSETYKNQSQIQAQISNGYFSGQGGVVSLIKNKKIGNAGKTSKYCTFEEAEKAGLKIEDLDLTKIKNELEPFIMREL